MTAPIFEPDASPLALAFVFAGTPVVIGLLIYAGCWFGVAR